MVITVKSERKTDIKQENKSTIARLESLHEQFLVRKVYALQTKLGKLEKETKAKDDEIKLLCKQLEHYHTKQHIAEQEKLHHQIDELQAHCSVLQEDLRTERAITAQLHAEYQMIMANCLLSAKNGRISNKSCQKRSISLEEKSVQCNILKQRKVRAKWIAKVDFTKLLLMTAFYFLVLFFIFIQFFIFGSTTPWDMKFVDEPLIV